tara:strand:+ start:352 stop:471 length:120 start_codon:yes stop_codon:yes gene_type:complete
MDELEIVADNRLIGLSLIGICLGRKKEAPKQNIKVKLPI